MNAARRGNFFQPNQPEGDDVEARIARLESDVEHIKRDVQSMHGRLEAANESLALARADLSAIKATLSYLATREQLRRVEGSLASRITFVEGTITTNQPP